MEAGASSSRRQRQRPHGAFKEELSMEAGAGSRLRQRRGPYGAFKEVAEPLFSVGAQVEVSRESKNYGAAWLAATIVSMISKSIFLVDCKTPRAVTDRELSTEIVDAQHIRPPPPLALDDEDFRLHDVVEVLYHGGWSLGVVTQISNGSKYIVKLKHHEEEMEFNCFEMRSCQVWEDGQWISYSSQSMKQYSQEELKTRKRGRPAKKSIESEQAEDLPEQVAEEEHGKKEIEQSNQGQSCDASFETRAHSHHDEATGYKDPPLLANMQEQFMHKNRLQEYAQRSSIPLPIYQTVNEGHPYASQFRSTVLIDGVTFMSSRTFPRRKEAEQDVAKLALEGISRKIKDEGIPLIHADTTFCKSILHEYAVKMYIEKPAYTRSQLEGVLLPSFISSLVFDGKTYTGAAGRNKKEAEQIAARAVIQSILAHSDTRIIMSEIVKSKGKLYAAIQKNNDSGLSHLGNAASGQQARNDSSGSTVKRKKIQAAPANDDLAGVANHKQLLLGQRPAAAETEPLLEAKKPIEEYPCEQSFGPIGGGTSPPVLSQDVLPSGLKRIVFESSDGSYHAEQNQVNDLDGPSMQSYDAQYRFLVARESARGRSRREDINTGKHRLNR